MYELTRDRVGLANAFKCNMKITVEYPIVSDRRGRPGMAISVTGHCLSTPCRESRPGTRFQMVGTGLTNGTEIKTLGGWVAQSPTLGLNKPSGT